MMNRRGVVRAHTHWRPRKRPAVVVPAARQAPTKVRGRTRSERGWRRAGVMVGLAAVLATGFWVTSAIFSGGGQGASALPQSPVAWLDSFSAALARDPARVCSQLVTGGFRAALREDAHRSCLGYYLRERPAAVRIVRIVRDGATAALVLRYWPNSGYSTFVLSRDGRGWRAIMRVAGSPQ